MATGRFMTGSGSGNLNAAPLRRFRQPDRPLMPALFRTQSMTINPVHRLRRNTTVTCTNAVSRKGN